MKTIDPSQTSPSQTKPVLGVSACLLGQEVRYNGGHKRSRYLTSVLADYVSYVPLCPEVGVGMSVPRPTIRMAVALENGRAHPASVPRVIASDQELANSTTHDWAPELRRYAASVQSQIEQMSGYVFMQKSPSCGVGSAKVYGVKGQPLGSTDGAYADAIIRANPLLPVVEAGQLNDAPIRANFISRVYAYQAWQQLQTNLTAAGLIAFHQRHKLMLMAHNEHATRALGRQLANLRKGNLESIAESYIRSFMEVTRKPAPRKRQANVLQRVLHYLKKQLNLDERQELGRVIEHYRTGIVPLIVPVTLLGILLRKYRGHDDAMMLSPYPYDLGLQNEI